MPRRVTDTRKPAPTSKLTLMPGGDRIAFSPETGGSFVGDVEQVNALLTALGYHEIAVRRNLMSRIAYIEAKDEPLCTSPASETYWSM